MQPANAEPPPEPLPDRVIRRSLRINIIAGTGGMAWAAATMGMPLPMLMELVGATGLQIGALTTVRLLATSLQIPGALWAERLHSRKLYWAICSALHRAVWFAPALLAIILRPNDPLFPALLIAAAALSDLLANAGSASWFSWMADLVPQNISGRFWGVRQTILTTAGLLAAAAMGLILDAFPQPEHGTPVLTGFAIVFSLAAALGVLDILVHLGVAEPPPLRTHPGTPLRQRVLGPFANRDFLLLTLAMGAWALACGIPGSFNVIYLKREFGATYAQLSWFFITASLGAALSGIAAGRLIDRLGGRTLAAILMVAGPALGACWFFLSHGTVHLPLPGGGTLPIPQAVALTTAVNFLAGAVYSGVILCHFRLLSALVPARGRTVAMAVHWTAVGCLGALGPTIGGIIMDRFPAQALPFSLPLGPDVSFFQILVGLHLALAWFLALPLLLMIRRTDADVPVPTALARLFPANPLQVLRNAYGGTTASANTTQARATTLRRLASALAPGSSPDAFEAAARALGNLPGPDSAAILRRALASAPSEPCIRAAREALARCGDGPSQVSPE
jgi:MFS family permease